LVLAACDVVVANYIHDFVVEGDRFEREGDDDSFEAFVFLKTAEFGGYEQEVTVGALLQVPKKLMRPSGFLV
jgi:hypothetical protein